MFINGINVVARTYKGLSNAHKQEMVKAFESLLKNASLSTSFRDAIVEVKSKCINDNRVIPVQNSNSLR